MENEQAKPVEPEWDSAKCREGIGVLATELVRLKEVLRAQGELLQGIDTRVRALTGLLDHHHEVLTKLASLPPRPKEDPRAN